MSRRRKKIALKKLDPIKPRRKFAPDEKVHSDKSKYSRKFKHPQKLTE